MRRIMIPTVAIAAVLVAAGAWRAAGPQAAALRGAWVATGWQINGTPVATPQRGLLVFTGSHYSMMFVPGVDARPGYDGESLTDAEKLAAYDSFVANSGRYRVSGDTLVTSAYMAKDPNYMNAWARGCSTGPCPNDVALTFRVAGDTLWVSWPASFGGSGNQRTGEFRRVE